MSALLPKADIRQRIEHVCFVSELKFGTLAWLTNAWLAPGVKISFSLFEGLGLYTCEASERVCHRHNREQHQCDGQRKASSHQGLGNGVFCAE